METRIVKIKVENKNDFLLIENAINDAELEMSNNIQIKKSNPSDFHLDVDFWSVVIIAAITTVTNETIKEFITFIKKKIKYKTIDKVTVKSDDYEENIS